MLTRAPGDERSVRFRCFAAARVRVRVRVKTKTLTVKTKTLFIAYIPPPLNIINSLRPWVHPPPLPSHQPPSCPPYIPLFLCSHQPTKRTQKGGESFLSQDKTPKRYNPHIPLCPIYPLHRYILGNHYRFVLTVMTIPIFNYALSHNRHTKKHKKHSMSQSTKQASSLPSPHQILYALHHPSKINPSDHSNIKRA